MTFGRIQEPRNVSPVIARVARPGHAFAAPFPVFMKANATSTSPALSPGGTGDAFKGEWGGSSWSASSIEIEVNDPLSQAFALEDDVLWAQLNPTSNRYEIMHPHRLRVKVKPDATLAAGSSATCSVWSGGSDSGVNITVSFTWMDANADDVSTGIECIAEYFSDESEWFLVNADCEAA